MNLGQVSYGMAALAYCGLLALLLAGRRGAHTDPRLLAAAACSIAWAALFAWFPVQQLPPAVVLLTESLRGGAWLLVLAGIGASVVPRWVAVSGHAVWSLPLAISLFVLVDAPGSGLFAGLMQHAHRVGLFTAILVLILLEQIYRNADARARQGLKWLVAALATLFTFDLFLYSQMELLRVIETNAWHARGVVNVLAVPMLVMAVRRGRPGTSEIFVSRHVVYFSTTIMLAGAYLLLMALGAYYLRAVGRPWSGFVEVLFVSLGMITLALLLFSDSLRARLRVFISKHFYRNKYDYRVEWLRFIRTMSSQEEQDVRRTAIKSVAQIIGSPGGMLYMCGESARSYVPVAAWPFDLSFLERAAPLDESSPVVEFLRQRQWIIDLHEYRQNPGPYGNIELPHWLQSDRELRIVLPMLELDRLVGFFILHDPPGSYEMTYEDRDLLRTVGQHVATQIAQYIADRQLAESRQFEAYSRLTAFVMHDLKNAVAQLRLVVTNAARHKQNPEFIEDAISTIGTAVDRIDRLIGQLRSDAKTNERTVALDELLAAICQRCEDRLPAPQLLVSDHSIWVRADSDRLGAVIEHVIRNAQDACRPGGSIFCAVTSIGGEARLDVADDGAGMSTEFLRDRLFRPFDSTKGAKGMGVGAYQAKTYIRSLGGEVEVQSNLGKGTRFTIMLPAAPEAQPEAGAS